MCSSAFAQPVFLPSWREHGTLDKHTHRPQRTYIYRKSNSEAKLRLWIKRLALHAFVENLRCLVFAPPRARLADEQICRSRFGSVSGGILNPAVAVGVWLHGTLFQCYRSVRTFCGSCREYDWNRIADFVSILKWKPWKRSPRFTQCIKSQSILRFQTSTCPLSHFLFSTDKLRMLCSRNAFSTELLEDAF